MKKGQLHEQQGWVLITQSWIIPEVHVTNLINLIKERKKKRIESLFGVE